MVRSFAVLVPFLACTVSFLAFMVQVLAFMVQFSAFMVQFWVLGVRTSPKISGFGASVLDL